MFARAWVVEALDVREFEQAYGREGRLAYPPRMMLKVWLYAFCLQVHSTRRPEQRIGGDLALSYLTGALRRDHKTLSEFLRRHRRAMNDVFTQVLGMARKAGLAQLGNVAIDSSGIGANAARSSVVEQRNQRAQDRLQVRRYQQKATQREGDENGGVVLQAQQQEALSAQLQAGTGLTPLRRSRRARVAPPTQTAVFCVRGMAGCLVTPPIWL